MRKNCVDIMVILGAIIHERYVHIGTQQGGDKTLRLDVISDKGRWIVNYSEFLGGLKSYILSRDEIAIVVCDMIDNYRALAELDKQTYRMIPPEIGNFDLDWLLWDYAFQELELKKIISDTSTIAFVFRHIIG